MCAVAILGKRCPVLCVPMRLPCSTIQGHSTWVSGEQSRSTVHQLRSLCDAVVVGGQTVRKDNCRLTTRRKTGHRPTRVVITRAMDLPRVRGGARLLLFNPCSLPIAWLPRFPAAPPLSSSPFRPLGQLWQRRPAHAAPEVFIIRASFWQPMFASRACHPLPHEQPDAVALT